MALTAGTPLLFDVGPAGNLNAQPVKANAQIWRGSAVGMTAGYARALVAADTFAGFSEQDVLGGTADGAITVPVIAIGRVQLAITGLVSTTAIGTSIYASDDGTFTTTSTSNSLIGVLWRYVTGTTGIVAFDLG